MIKHASKEIWAAGLVLAVAAFSSISLVDAVAKPAPAKPAEKTGQDKDKEKEKEKDKEKEKADAKAAAAKAAATEAAVESASSVTPQELVEKPHEFLGKNVKFDATFSNFSNLALDYKPAMRSSKTYLSFLVFRPNSKVPLSELKIAMALPKEKDPENKVLGNLKEGDQLELVGKVFSTALDDPWLDVARLKVIAKAPEEKKDEAAEAEKPDKLKDKDAHPEKPEKPEHPEVVPPTK